MPHAAAAEEDLMDLDPLSASDPDDDSEGAESGIDLLDDSGVGPALGLKL